MARSSMQAVVERLRSQLSSAQRWEVDVLNGALAPTDLTVPFTYSIPASVQAGAILDIGGETMRVVSVDTATLTATVIRGWAGSDAIDHEPSEVIWINPRFTSHQLVQAIIDEISSWPAPLFQVVGETVTVASGDETFELSATFVGAYHVLDVRKILTDSESTSWPRIGFRFQRGLPTTWTATTVSGLFIRLLDNYGAGTVYVEAAMPFDARNATIDTDLENDLGLTDSLIDLAMLGAKYRVLVDAEAGRSQRDAVGSEIDAQLVPPMVAAQLAQLARTMYLARRTEEIERLRALYPVRAS